MILLTTLDLDDVDTDVNYGQMIAVLRYKTPYIVAGKGPILSFALGNDVSLRGVLGLPTLLAMGADINLVKVYCHVLNLIVVFLSTYNLRIKVYPKALLSIITHTLFLLQFPLT